MMKKTSPTTYAQPSGEKKVEKSSQKFPSPPVWPLKIWPRVGGKAMIEAAKMTGMTPAMFTRSGR